MKEVEELKIRFGKNLKQQREAHRMSREELAEKCDLQPIFIAKIETGEKFVSAESLTNLARALNIEPHVLFTSGKQPRKKIETLLQEINELLDGKDEQTLRLIKNITALITANR